MGELEGAIGVVSTIGAFGNNEFMEKICGDANIKAAQTAKKAGKTRKHIFLHYAHNKGPAYTDSVSSDAKQISIFVENRLFFVVKA